MSTEENGLVSVDAIDYLVLDMSEAEMLVNTNSLTVEQKEALRKSKEDTVDAFVSKSTSGWDVSFRLFSYCIRASQLKKSSVEMASRRIKILNKIKEYGKLV